MSIAEFYLMNGIELGYNPFDHEYDDFFYGGYDSDDYYDYNDFGYDFSDSDYSACGTDDYFLETCLPSRHFPDKKQFPVEWVRSAMSIKSENLYPLTALPYGECISEKLDSPLLEQLWESLYYLKEIVSFGLLRVQNSDKLSDSEGHSSRGNDIWKKSIECFSSLPKDAQDIVDRWYHWCNDLYIDTLQSVIPAGLPYVVLVSIVEHLSRQNYSESRMLSTRFGAVHDDHNNQIIERFLLRNCILRITELIRIFYRCLYSELEWMDITINKMKLTLPALLRGLDLAMNRLDQFLDPSPKPSSKFLDYTVTKTFSVDMNAFFPNNIDDLSYQDEFDLFKIVLANTDSQNAACYLSMLTTHEDEMGAYNLLCISKDSLDSIQEAEDSFGYFYENVAMFSTEKPLLFCSDDLVASIGVNLQNSFGLTVWDMSEKSCRYFGKEIGEKWKQVLPEIWPMTLSDLKIKGILKRDRSMTVLFQVKTSCLIAKYDLLDSCLTKFDLKESCGKSDYDSQNGLSNFSLQQNQLNLLKSSYPLGHHGTTAYVMNLEENHTLDLVDLDNPGDVATYKINFECGADWKMQFDSDPTSDVCILYKGSNVQVRTLDHKLTLVKQLTLDLSYLSSSSLPENIELQFFNKIVYGFVKNKACIDSVKEDYLNQTKISERSDYSLNIFLQDRFLRTATGYDLHFLGHIDYAEQELICLDWGTDVFSNGLSNINSDFGEKYLFSEELSLEKALVGFNKRGELVKLSTDTNAENFILDLDKTSVECECLGLSFKLVSILTSMKDTKDLWSPSVQKVNQLLEKEKKRLETLRVEQEKLKKKLEKERLKREEELLKREETNKVMKKIVNKYIQQGTTVNATIEKWLLQEGYGFANVKINEGEGKKGTQSIFIHKSFVSSKDRRHLRKGTSFKCQLEWESNRPRPKAVNVKLLI